MTEERIRELTQAYIDAHWSIKDVISDTGGEGLCGAFSTELYWWFVIHHCFEDHMACGVEQNPRVVCLHPNLEWGDPFRLNPRYPCEDMPSGTYHEVLLVDGWVVDLTARQFDENLPFPFIWKPEQSTSRRRKCKD